MRFLFLLGLISTSFFGICPALPALQACVVKGHKTYFTTADRAIIMFSPTNCFRLYLQRQDDEDCGRYTRIDVSRIRFDKRGPYFLQRDVLKESRTVFKEKKPS